jgi:AbrB family looped-hinge helix DNA binding protein
MSSSILTSKGQTTIPKDIRKRLNLLPGDRLEFVIDEGGRQVHDRFRDRVLSQGQVLT